MNSKASCFSLSEPVSLRHFLVHLVPARQEDLSRSIPSAFYIEKKNNELNRYTSSNYRLSPISNAHPFYVLLKTAELTDVIKGS